MSGETPLDMPRCPVCGARNPPTAAVCSDCGRENPSLLTSAPIVGKDARAGGFGGAGQPYRGGQPWSSVTGVVVAIAFCLILAGVYRTSSGLALLLVLLIGPALVMTYTRAILRRVRASSSGNGQGPSAGSPRGPLTRTEKLTSFAMTLAMGFAVAAAIVGLLILAAAIALYLICMRN